MDIVQNTGDFLTSYTQNIDIALNAENFYECESILLFRPKFHWNIQLLVYENLAFLKL